MQKDDLSQQASQISKLDAGALQNIERQVNTIVASGTKSQSKATYTTMSSMTDENKESKSKNVAPDHCNKRQKCDEDQE
jgi:hypothetical protein